ncbi:unnamed protein product [Protopolystoma xenopodis]|uniref:Uncharacterized protein n=1 Tax=Protopolystoma xenopodis TaxID=117903 RepID=A0A3S5BRW4_9PLAT|nr:unnamed protein product [Protopolystoma xenopodis]
MPSMLLGPSGDPFDMLPAPHIISASNQLNIEVERFPAALSLGPNRFWNLPRLEVGDWLVWPGMGAAFSSTCSAVTSSSTLRVAAVKTTMEVSDVTHLQSSIPSVGFNIDINPTLNK